MSRIQHLLNSWSDREGVRHVILGVGKGGQTRDVNFTLSQCLEKGRDRFGACAIAIGDIAKCHDQLPWGACLRGFLRRGLSIMDASAIFRVIRCPCVRFRVGDTLTNAIERTRSALTGNLLSGSVARIVLEDSLVLARSNFTSGFQLSEQVRFDAMCWSDNLFTMADSVDSALHNFHCWESFLSSIFHMSVKDDSRVVIPCRTKKEGDGQLTSFGRTWQVKDAEKVLGCFLTSTGEDTSEREALCVSWNRVFWKHFRSLCNSAAPVSARMRFWKVLSLGVADFRLLGLRPSKQHGQQLEAYFNKFVARILKMRPEANESQASFCIRRNHRISAVKTSAKINIKRRWCTKLISWIEHLRRHPECPQSCFLDVQDDFWLRERRALVGGLGASRSIFCWGYSNSEWSRFSFALLQQAARGIGLSGHD